MRHRFHALLMGLTFMLGTIVFASGILTQPLPTETTQAMVGTQREGILSSRGGERPTVAKFPDVETPRAPRAEEQDPVRVPAQEPPAPIRAVAPGGIDGVTVPLGLGGNYLVHEGTQDGRSSPRTLLITVEVEEGLPVSPEEFSTFVMATLADERSWAKDGAIGFARTDSRSAADLRVILASPQTVDAECAPLNTNSKWSCGRYGKAMINADRWINNSPAFEAAGGDIETYRTYLINHEVGHLIGYQHETCTGGGLAPVMMQQSISVGSCTPNGWVHP